MIYKIILLLQESLKAVFAYKLRSLLSIISIALGIVGVTIVVGAVNGAYLKAYEIIDMFGPDSVLVTGGSQTNRAVGNRGMTITFDDITAVKNAFPTAYIVVPMSGKWNVNVGYLSNHTQTFIVGSTEGYSLSWNWRIAEGTDFTKEDIEKAHKKCIIGNSVKKEVFEKNDPIGKYITVGNMSCEVVGVMEERGVSSFGMDINDRVIMPVSVLSKYLTKEYKYVRAMRVKFEDVDNIDLRIEELKNFLRLQHNIPDSGEDDFSVVGPKDVLKFFMAIGGALVGFLTVITVITIAVGGFVMANLFMISIQERTKEIGIRRALGATKNDIFLQFIFEFIIITFLGSLMGFATGALLAKIISSFDVFEVVVSFKIFLLAVATSVVVAIIFGVTPARNASKLNPINAIRG